MINEKQIEYLIEVANEGNITKAAKKLYISQSALSQMIISIEKEIGATLFNRDSNPLTLTWAGEQYLDACVAVKKRYEETIDQIKEHMLGNYKQLVLGIPLHMSIFMSHLIIPKFNEICPECKLVLRESSVKSLPKLVSEGEVDLAIIYDKSVVGLDYKIISEGKTYVIIPPFLHNKNIGTKKNGANYIRVSELAGLPFIQFKRGHLIREISKVIFDKFDFTPNVALETDSVEVAFRLAKNNVGYTIIPSLGLEYSSSYENESFFILEDYQDERKIIACYRKNALKKGNPLEVLLEIISKLINM